MGNLSLPSLQPSYNDMQMRSTVLITGLASSLASSLAATHTFAVWGDYGTGCEFLGSFMTCSVLELLTFSGLKQIHYTGVPYAADLQKEDATAINKYCAKYNCEFMLTLGDNFYDVRDFTFY